MHRFLVDANLPYRFSIWNDPEFIHLKDIDDSLPDEKVWEYARENNLTIITKDSDFSNRILFHSPPPKVIHIRFGNMKMRQFYETLQGVWSEVLVANEKYKLVNIYADRIECIG